SECSIRRTLRDRNARREGARGTLERQVSAPLGVPRPPYRHVNSGRVLAVLAATELLAMSPWFSASAVAPALLQHWHFGPEESAWLTISVQLGFVSGAFVSAAFSLADIWSATRLVAVCSWLAGAATLGVILAPGPRTVVVLRALTGVALAGV